MSFKVGDQVRFTEGGITATGVIVEQGLVKITKMINPEQAVEWSGWRHHTFGLSCWNVSEHHMKLATTPKGNRILYK
jgi:hypothetical protein